MRRHALQASFRWFLALLLMNWGKKEKAIDILDLSTRQVTQTIGKSLFNFYDTKVNSPFTVCEFSLQAIHKSL